MKRITSILLAAATAVFLLPPAESRDLFVSKAGDDSTGESWESAYLSIGRALSEADPGDAVHVAAGVYIESVTIPVGVSLLGGHPSQSSDTVVHNRNPRIHTTTIGATEELSTIRVRHNSVLDGFTIFGRAFQQFEGPPGTRNRITIRTCSIYYEHSDINMPAILAGGNDLLMEECLIRYYTEQPTNFFRIGGECQIVNTIFTYDLPLETRPIVLAGSGPYRFVNCVFYDRGEFDRPNTLAPTTGSITLEVHNSISNQNIAVTSGGPFANRVTSSIVPFPPAFMGSFSADPQFIDPDNDDFRVHSTSPAIDRGGVAIGWTTLLDFMGRTRVVDIPGVGGTGTFAIDIGAYEMQLDEYRLRSDFNWDGVVDALDLLIFSQEWHRTSSP